MIQTPKTTWSRDEVDAIIAAVREDSDRKAAALIQGATADALAFFASVVEKLEFTNSDPATLEGAKLAQDKIAALARMAAERFREQQAAVSGGNCSGGDNSVAIEQRGD